MNSDLLEVFASTIAVIGIVVCAVAGVGRLFGSYYVFGYEAMTLFIGGISLMVFSGLIKLHLIKALISRKP